jgi:diadenosine tetraphosphate (Ap4A) HIT family hydrolase
MDEFAPDPPRSAMPDFALDPRLAADTHPVADWPVSRLLLMDDARFPWLVLVPRVAGARELHALPSPTRTAALDEVVRAAAALERATGAGKMNVAALGNLVPQLHVHVVARREGDAAWPGPVWGVPGREPWGEVARRDLLARFEAALGET